MPPSIKGKVNMFSVQHDFISYPHIYKQIMYDDWEGDVFASWPVAGVASLNLAFKMITEQQHIINGQK